MAEDGEAELARLDELYLIAFTSTAGRQVLEDMFWAYYERPLISPNDQNPNQMMAFRAGQQSVVRDIRAALRRARNQGKEDEFITQEELET